MPVNVGWLNEKPQYWSTYLPNKDDYETGEDFLKAISDGSKAYYEDSAPIGQYWDPIGQVTRGGAQTEVEQGLRKLQHKFNKIGTDPLNNMGLQNWITLHPDLAMAAYGAYTPTGEPVLDPAMLALIERLLKIEAKPAPAPTEENPQAVVSDNPPSVTAPQGMVMGPDGTWVPDPNGTTAHKVWGGDGHVELPNSAQPGKPVQGSDGTWWIVNPDGSASLMKNPPATGPGSAWNPIPGQTQNSDGTYNVPQSTPPTSGSGQGQGGVGVMPGPRQPQPQPQTEQYTSSYAPTNADAILDRFGIKPPPNAQGTFGGGVDVPGGNAPGTYQWLQNPGAQQMQGMTNNSSSLYPPQMLQRLQDLRKNVLYGNKPMPPKIGY
jgi:hypothetical protein